MNDSLPDSVQPAKIYLSPPHTTGAEQEIVAEAIASNWLAPVGPHLAEFERRFAQRIGVNSAVAVASGTAALHLALRNLALRPDDEVICSTLTFCASANPVVYEGAKPVFLDSERQSWNLDPELLRDELAERARVRKLPRAIIAVDIFGQSADMNAIKQLADQYEIALIEDAAEALGATYRDEPVGKLAWASVFSFNGNKIMTTSGGGMLCSNDESLIHHARFLATQARDDAPHYQHSQIGFNYRMSNLLAAVGLAQLAALDDFIAARRRNFEFYRERLIQLPGVSMMPEAAYGRSNRWLTVMLVDGDRFGATPDDLRIALAAQNIESRPVWKPLHLQPVFANCRHRTNGVAEDLFRRGLCLPSGSALNEVQLDRVCSCIESVYAKAYRQRAA
jgi:pyridoxal phosphate-dependent aminotransferase EpsN